MALAGQEGVQLSYHWLDSAWEPDRLGRRSHTVPGHGRSRVSRSRWIPAARAAAARELPPRVRPRGGASLLVPGGRLVAAPASRRGRPRITERRLQLSSTAARTPRPRPRWRRTRSRSSPKAPSRSPTSSRERSRGPTGRGSCSTRMQRVTRPWAAPWSRSHAASADLLRPGHRAADATLASRTSPLSLAPRRPRAATHIEVAGIRQRRRPLRGTGGGQTSTAIRSSERLKTNAPSASATAAATIV